VGLSDETDKTDKVRLLQERINRQDVTIAVIGLGYVGLPLFQAFAEAGFKLAGYDVSQPRIETILSAFRHKSGIKSGVIQAGIGSGSIRLGSKADVLKDADVFIICVPTPLTQNQVPDMSYVEASLEIISDHIKPYSMVVLESTTYPGTTEMLVKTRLQREDLRLGENFFIAFFPERIDPGNQRFQIANTPKIVGGITDMCTESAAILYSKIVDTVVRVSSPSVAEMAKIFENSYRAINIALVNEFAMLCHRMEINVWEVLEAAATKPFGISVFKPGPGVGGHCIPFDPFFLAWRAQEFGVPMHFIELAGEINRNMPNYVVERITRLLNDELKPLRGSKVALIGVTYKPDVPDLRESPALYIAKELERRGAHVFYRDPYVPEVFGQEPNDWAGTSVSLQDAIHNADCVALITPHQAIDYSRLLASEVTIFDASSYLRRFPHGVAHVVPL